MTTPVIRNAEQADIPEILSLIKDLAAYEKEPDAVKLTEEKLSEQLFGPHPSVFVCVAEAEPTSSHRIDGFALWFLNFSTWEGTHGIYLEDLFVRPEARGTGKGKALLTHLAHLATTNGYNRVEWSVLTWNTPAIEFYRSLGAVPLTEWNTFRLSGEALQRY
ncbi:GNAT family N-acetyltransferase [Corynebacterium poyangense]|uniref:GNAT family N-acetyltransferase n=1 Tax=Corynebacterium poyangense TaxID=2684405 RepID=A0A7H0SR78_9CORY|nr:GNAT family N-acetyltransferase [Corynebacterium poyangense]QNQ91053.1 GNAT family N-acetyltransferase [Corynebacterium poyangense]